MNGEPNQAADTEADPPAKSPPTAIVSGLASGAVDERIQQQLATERRNWAARFQRVLAVVIVVLLGFLALLLALGIVVVNTVQQRAQGYARAALEASKALQVDSQSDTVTKLARLSLELGKLTAKTETLAEEQAQIRMQLQQQEAARARENELVRSDMVRFRTWYENESAQLAKRINDVQSNLAERVQVRERWQEEMPPVPAPTVAAMAPTSAPPPDAGLPAHSNGAVTTVTAMVAGAGATEETNALAAADRRERVKLKLLSGEVYEGTATSGVPDGEGTCLYPNGNRYTGQFQKGKRHGHGTYVFMNGDKYEGAYEEDARQGQGVYTYRDGSRYEGEFKSGKRNGKGKYTYRNGGQYIGDFKDGQKDGWGTYVGPNGTRLEGTWQNDQFVSAGMLP